jgi:exopolyphosphatase/guanosine-5'-triphosphate,3'-diphosphate pyrophosphatase
VVDIGSNTVHLLVARSDGRTLTPLLDTSAGLELGSDVDAAGAISESKLAATMRVLRDYQAAAHEAGAVQVRLLATQALRAAANGDAVAQAIAAATGLAVHILAPEEEAALAFLGAALTDPSPAGRVVIDIGGGSMQVAVGEGEVIKHSTSLPLGARRLVNHFLPHDPPTAAEAAALRAHLAAVIPPALPPPGDLLLEAVAVGGVARRLPALVGSQVGTILPFDALDHALDAVQGRAAAAIAADYGIDEARARLLLPAILTLREVLADYDSPPLLVAPYGLREGAILHLARHGSITL